MIVRHLYIAHWSKSCIPRHRTQGWNCGCAWLGADAAFGCGSGAFPHDTYQFSLARRFPVAQFSVMLLPLLLITACEPGQLKEGLAPNESDVVQVTVLPAKSTITVAETVLVSASARTATGQSARPRLTGPHRVVATEQTSTLADTSSVTLSTATPVLEAVVLTPASVTVAAGGTQQFNVGGRWSDGSTTAPSVTFSTTGGTITPGGLFTAGSVTGTFQVIAVQQGGTLADTSAVSVSTSAPMLEAVILTPSSVAMSDRCDAPVQRERPVEQWSHYGAGL